MAQSASIGFGRRGSLDLGVQRLPTGIVHSDSLGSDVLALITSAATTTTNANLGGNAKGTSDNSYFAWDGGRMRTGFTKSSGFDGALGYAGNVVTGGDPLPTLDIVQMLGQSSIDPLGGGTRTLRAQWDNNGDFRNYTSAFITGSTTLSSSLSVTGVITASSTSTFTGMITANGGVTTASLAVAGAATVGGSNIIKVTDAASSAPPAIATTGSLGAVNTRFAREDHTHAMISAAGNFVSSLAVVNNATVNVSTGAVTITNSLTPTFTTVTATGATTLAGVTATTATFSGAHQINSTLGVTGASTLAGLTATTATFSGATQVNSTLGVTGTSTLAAVIGTSGSFSSTMLITGALTSKANVVMQNSGGTPIFTFDVAASTLTAPSQSINGSVLVDSSVAYGKLSGTAQAVIQAFPSSDSKFSMLRWVTSTGTFPDPNTGQERDGLTINNGATRVADGSAYAGYSIANTGMTTNVLAVSGPAYTGLAPGQYQAIYYLKVNSTVSTSAVVQLQVTGTAISGNPVVSAAPSELGTTYVGVAVPFTVTATTNIVNTTITSNQLPGAVTWQFSHVRIQQFDGKAVASSVQYFFADASIKNAQIFDLTTSKLTAGVITTDDIQIGAGGRIYIGASKTASTRIEWTSAGLVAYAGGTPTFNLSSSGSLSLTGSITGASSIMIGSTGFGVDTAGNMWLGASTYAGATNFSVSAAGSLTAKLGVIGGWSLGTSTLTGTNVTLDSTGTVSVGTGSAIVSMTQGTGLWAGNAAFGSAPFRVDTAGNLTTSGTTTLGGTLSVTGVTTLNNTLSLGTGAISSTNFSVTSAGVVTATSATLNSVTVAGTSNLNGSLVLGGTLTVGSGTSTTVIQSNANIWFGAAKPKGVIQYATATATSTSTTGGSIPAGAYTYAIVATNSSGLFGTVVYAPAITTTGATSTVTVTWTNTNYADPNSEYEAATQIRIYRQLYGLTANKWYLVSSALATTTTSFVDTTGSLGLGGSFVTAFPVSSQAALYFDGGVNQTLTLSKTLNLNSDLTMANGSVFRTGPLTGDRIEITNGSRNTISFYSGDATEISPASLGFSFISGTRSVLSMSNSQFSSGITGTSSFSLENNTSRGWIKMNASTSVQVTAPALYLNGNWVLSALSGGLIVQSGTGTATFSAAAAVAGSTSFAQTFASTPVVIPAIQVGSNLDILINIVSVSTTGFNWRAFNKTGSAVTGTATIHYVALA